MGLTLLVVLAAGCQPLRTSGAKAFAKPLSRPKPSPDVAILEILTVDVAPNHASQLQKMWDEVDDQAIGVEARQRCDRNGFRAGVAASQLPAAVHALINASTPDSMTAMPYKQVQSRAGETFDLAVTTTPDTFEWQVLGEQGVERTGSTANAVAGFSLRTKPFGDRSVQLAITPRLCHGGLHQKYTLEQNQFLLRPLLDETDFSELTFDCRLRVGQTLILGGAAAGHNLGNRFFVQPGGDHQRIVLIRLVQSPADDLFAPTKSSPSLVTPGL